MRVFGLSPKGYNDFVYFDKMTTIGDIISDSDTNEEWELKVIEMDADKFKSLPEHMGW